MAGRIVNVRPKKGYVFDGRSVVPQGSNVVSIYQNDSFLNAMTGTGTNKDARTAGGYIPNAMTREMIEAAYRGSGIVRKVIDSVPLDMVREWRNWTGLDADEISALFDEERRLGLRQKVLDAEILRGLGGGAFILGLPGKPNEEARPGGKGSLAFVHVVSRWHLRFQKLEDDPQSARYGEPIMWQMDVTSSPTPSIDIHPSRVIPFRADTAGMLGSLFSGGMEDYFWGQPKIAQIIEAARDFDSAFASFAALIHKARLLRIGIPNLYEMIISGEWKEVSERLTALGVAESIHNATVFDSGDNEGNGAERIEDATYSFAGAKDMLNSYGERLCAVADIPSTRLLGRAPEGMNSSGDSQQRDWDKKVGALQELRLGPCLEKLDEFLVPSALGSNPDTVAYEWAPLDQPSEKERAETLHVLSQAIEKLQGSVVIPDEAFAEGVQSLLIERGDFPSLERALKAYSDDERYGIGLPDDPTGEGGDLDLEGGAGLEADPPRRVAANDAAPRTLYVSRKVKNRADLQRWATEQGLGELQTDLHVTVAYSRTPVDWMKAEEEWTGEDDGGLLIKPGGPRVVEPLGDRTAVLMFSSSHLAYRHERIRRDAGASWDWPDYQPHISLTGDPVDLSSVEPYRGKIELGPEIFEEIDEGRE